MRIAIEALGIHYFGGGRTATLTLLNGLFSIDPLNQYTVYLSQEEKWITSTNNVQQVICPFKNRFINRIWAQAILSHQSRNFDLIHFVKNLGVLGLNIPSVVTIYDLTTLIHPELFPVIDVLYWKTIEKYTLQNVSRIIAISKTTAKDVEKYYPIHPDKIKVIYPSIDARFKPASQIEILSIREKYQLPERYILHVGRIDRKKNLPQLVRAFGRSKSISPNIVDHLVIVGEVYEKAKDNALLPMIENLGLTKNVIFTGRVPDEDLPVIISGADISISVSFHEGFGLAAIESLACGVPVIAYRAGALQEALGDAAIVVESLDEEIIAQAIVKLVTDPELCKELSRKGILQAHQYDAINTAQQTLKLYEEVVNETNK